MAHRLVAAVLALAALLVLPFHPLVSLVLFGMALADFMNGRGAFGSGLYRTILAFISSLWLIVLGTITTLLGLVPNAAPCETEPCQGNFLFVPGALLLVSGLTLLAWSIVLSLRARRSMRMPRT